MYSHRHEQYDSMTCFSACLCLMFLNEPWEKAWKNSNQSVTILSGQCIERKLNKYTNEADGSAYERVEVATSSVDVSLGPSTTIPLRQTAEQDGLSNHYLWAQHTTAQHLFSVVPNEERAYVAACGHLKKKFCTQHLLSERSAIFVRLLWALLVENIGSVHCCSF